MVGHRIALIELNPTGHRFWYVSLLIERLRGMDSVAGIDLYTDRSAPISPEWRTHLARHEKAFTARLVDTAEMRRSTLLEVAASRAAKVLIPDGDTWLTAATTVSNSAEYSLLLTRPFPGDDTPSRARWIAKTALTRLATARPNVRVLRLGMGDAGSHPAQEGWLPDPVQFEAPASREARSALGLSHDTNLSLLCGGLSARKSVLQVLEAWQAVRDAHAVLALVGPCSEPDLVGRIVEQARHDPRMVARLSYVPDQELDMWIAAADRCLVLNDNPGSSGIALKAWAAETAIVARSPYLLAALRQLRAHVIPVSGPLTSQLPPVIQGGVQASPGVPPSQLELHHRIDAFVDGFIGDI